MGELGIKFDDARRNDIRYKLCTGFRIVHIIKKITSLFGNASGKINTENLAMVADVS